MNTECIGCGEPTPDDERVGDGLCEACAKPDFEFPAQAGTAGNQPLGCNQATGKSHRPQ